MRGLIIDYVGVLDGTDEDQRRWRNLLETVRQVGIPTAVLSNDPGGPAADPIRVLETQGIVDAVLLSGEIGAEKPSKEAFQAAADALVWWGCITSSLIERLWRSPGCWILRVNSRCVYMCQQLWICSGS